MLTNKYICEKFFNKQSCENRNMKSTGDKLYSYNLCIGRWINNRVEVLDTKSSLTTNRHIYELKSVLWKHDECDWAYVKPKFVSNAINGYNYNQFPNINEEYKRVEKPFLKTYQVKEYLDWMSHQIDSFFVGYSIDKSSVDNYYHINSHYKHTEDFYENYCDILLNAEFKECEICSGLGFLLTKNMREKKCKHCSRGVLLCLKN